MAMTYLNPVHSSAIEVDALGTSTYHTLSGQAQQILFITTGSIGFYVNFDTTSDMAAVSTQMQRFSGVNPELINVNKPAFVNVLGEATGYIYCMEFV